MNAPQVLCSSPEAFAILATHLSSVLLVGVLLAGFAGKLIAEAVWYGVLLYLRRRPSFRRFDRAMRRVFA
jgi:endonuclease V-like protein UPF0215 family